jgi:hypothetical protein
MKKIRVPVVIGVVALLTVGAVLLLPQIGSGSGCEGQGACMLYFYADD